MDPVLREQQMIEWKERRIAVSRRLACSPESAWRVVTDTACWAQWGPSITRVRCSHRFVGPGSTGSVRTALGFWVPFAITDYEHLRFWSWRVGRFRATGHRLTAIGEHACRLSFDLPWWAFPYVLICLAALARIGRICESGAAVR